MYQALFFSLSSQRSKEAKNKKITPDLRLIMSLAAYTSETNEPETIATTPIILYSNTVIT